MQPWLFLVIALAIVIALYALKALLQSRPVTRPTALLSFTLAMLALVPTLYAADPRGDQE